MPRRILAIDDDPISLAVAAVLLESEGCMVQQADSGEQALELLATIEPPDCVIADLRMPSLAGPELAAQLRRTAPHARLLAMSATPPPQVDGYDAVLKKPLSVAALHALFGSPNSAASHQPEDRSNDDGSAEPVFLDSLVFDRLRRAMPLPALEEVICAFLNDTGTRIASMRSADSETTCRQAHTVKGGAAMVGAIRVSATASALEAGIDDHGERLQKLDELEFCLRRTEVILKERLKI